MKIPVDIEPHLLDYLEGNLSGVTLAKVEAYVNANPEVLDELIGMPTLQSPTAKMNTSPLIIEEDVEQLMLEALDSSQSNDELAELNDKIKDSVPLQKEWALYQKTKLVADNSTTMPNKSRLYKKGVVIPFASKFFYRVAAAILILVGSSLSYWFAPKTTPWYTPNTLVSATPWNTGKDIIVLQKTREFSTENDHYATTPSTENRNKNQGQNTKTIRNTLDAKPLKTIQDIALLATNESPSVRITDIPQPVFTLPEKIQDISELNTNSYNNGLVAYAVKKVRRKLGLQSTPSTAAAIDKNELAYLTEKSISTITNGQINTTLQGDKSVSIRSKRLFLEIN